MRNIHWTVGRKLAALTAAAAVAILVLTVSGSNGLTTVNAKMTKIIANSEARAAINRAKLDLAQARADELFTLAAVDATGVEKGQHELAVDAKQLGDNLHAVASMKVADSLHAKA